MNIAVVASFMFMDLLFIFRQSDMESDMESDWMTRRRWRRWRLESVANLGSPKNSRDSSCWSRLIRFGFIELLSGPI